MRGFTMDFSSYNRSAYGISSSRIVVSVTFLAVGVNTFPKYDSHYHDCHDNFNIFVKTILTKKLRFVKPEISLSVLMQSRNKKPRDWQSYGRARNTNYMKFKDSDHVTFPQARARYWL